MGSQPRIRLSAPLAVGVGAIAVSILIHAVALYVVVNFLRREMHRGNTGRRFWVDVPIVGLTILLALAAHLLEIALWAVLLMICGQFEAFSNAYYHAALSYTTLGDVALLPKWSLLSPLEAIDGMLMFGVSTAMIFAIIQLLFRARYSDLRN